MLAPKMRNIHLLQSLLAKEQQLQVGEVPFLIYELEDEDAIGAFWEAASSGAKDCKDESERRICPDDGKLSLSHKLLGMEWLISSHCFRLCRMQRVGLLLPLWANNHPKKLEHEWKHHDLPRLPKDGDVPFHGEFLICVYLVKGTPSGSYWQLTVANILPKTLVTIGVMPWHLSWW